MADQSLILVPIQRLILAGQFAQARESLDALMRKKSSPVLDNLMAICLARLGELERAEFYAERAAAASSTDPDVLVNYANVLSLRGVQDRAVKVYTKVLDLKPDSLHARLGVANALRALGMFTKATGHLRLALDLSRDPDIEATLATTLASAGSVDEGWSVVEGALKVYPDSEMVAYAAGYLSHFVPGLTAQEIREVHLGYGRLLTRTMGTPLDPPRLPRTGRSRVGLLSQDFRQHSVAYFAMPLVTHLPREHFEVVCLSACPRGDAMTRKFREGADEFHDVSRLSNDALAARVRDLRIDILMDLSGLTLGHRMPVFQRRPARVQVSYMGYPCITGLSTIDARIVDELTDPPAQAEPGPERLVRLAAPFLCYAPPETAPKPGVRPAGSVVTFGSFNVVPKINELVLDCWARILQGVPGSGLLLKASQFADLGTRERCITSLKERGIDPSRVEILPPAAETAGHLGLYARMDIALDTFPYNGTTTTCEALWQSVPVVTLAGDRHAARVGVSLLTAVGIPELIARNADDYVRLAVELAGDPARLLHYRTTLRDRVRQSPLCDAPAFGRRFGELLMSLEAGASQSAAGPGRP